MKILENIKSFLMNLNHKARAYDADFQHMTDEERAYEKNKLHELVNTRPYQAKSEVTEFRDISAD